jgi:hypothetical protein
MHFFRTDAEGAYVDAFSDAFTEEIPLLARLVRHEYQGQHFPPFAAFCSVPSTDGERSSTDSDFALQTVRPATKRASVMMCYFSFLTVTRSRRYDSRRRTHYFYSWGPSPASVLV